MQKYYILVSKSFMKNTVFEERASLIYHSKENLIQKKTYIAIKLIDITLTKNLKK